MNVNHFLKSNSCFIIATVLLAITYLLVWRIQPDTPVELTKCLPDSTLVYFEEKGINAVDPVNVTDTFLEKIFKSIDIVAVAENIGVERQTIAKTQVFIASIKSLQSDPVIRALYKKRHAFALLNKNETCIHSSEGNDFFQDSLIIISEKIELSHLMAMLSPGQETKRNFINVQYGRHRILRFSGPYPPLSLAVLDDLVIACRNEKQLRRCIDIFDGEQPSFSDNPLLCAISENSPEADSLLVFSSAAFAHLPFSLKDLGWLQLLVFRQFLSFSELPVDFAYSNKKSGSKMRGKILLDFTLQHGDRVSTIQHQHNIPANSNSIPLVTADPMFYLWTDSFDIKNFFEGKGEADLPQEEASIGTHFKNILQYLTLLGSGITLVAEKADEDSLLPIPLAMIFIPFINQENVQNALTRFFENYDIPMTKEGYGAVEYSYWSQSPQEGITPLYGFLGDMFFAGNSPTLLKKIIDFQGQTLYRTAKSLFETNIHDATTGKHLLIYANNEQCIHVIKESLKALGTIIAIEDREIAKKVLLVNDKIISPLLDGLKMYKNSVISSYFKERMLHVDVMTEITD